MKKFFLFASLALILQNCLAAQITPLFPHNRIANGDVIFRFRIPGEGTIRCEYIFTQSNKRSCKDIYSPNPCPLRSVEAKLPYEDEFTIDDLKLSYGMDTDNDTLNYIFICNGKRLDTTVTLKKGPEGFVMVPNLVEFDFK